MRNKALDCPGGVDTLLVARRNPSLPLVSPTKIPLSQLKPHAASHILNRTRSPHGIWLLWHPSCARPINGQMDLPGAHAVWQSSSNFTLWPNWLTKGLDVRGLPKSWLAAVMARHSTCIVRTSSSMVSSNLELACEPCFCPCRYPSGNAHTNQLLECESNCAGQHLQLLAVVPLAPRSSLELPKHPFTFPAVCLLVTILSTVAAR